MALQTPAEADQYFVSYNDVTVHEVMIKDKPRMEAYLNALTNAELEGKVVLDVGCGTGVLAMFAARCGAKKVYAVEASGFAPMARELVQHNGLGDTVEVLQGLMEDVVLPEKVDVIVSEWMGFYLLHESMLASVLVARDRWLKPGGAMLPSEAVIYAAPVQVDDLWADKYECWLDVYGLDFSPLVPLAQQAVANPNVRTVAADQLLAPPQEYARLDMVTQTPASLETLTRDLAFAIARDGNLGGFALWFDCIFAGPPGCEDDITTLSTAPGAPDTHWHQTVVLLPDRYGLEAGVEIPVRISMAQSHSNPRHYAVSVSMGDDGDNDDVMDEDPDASDEDDLHEPDCDCIQCRLVRACDAMYEGQPSA